MTTNLYLVIERRKRGYWSGGPLLISKVSKKKPTLPRPTEQALVQLAINLPDRLLEPRTVTVQINPDHIIPPAATAASTP